MRVAFRAFATIILAWRGVGFGPPDGLVVSDSAFQSVLKLFMDQIEWIILRVASVLFRNVRLVLVRHFVGLCVSESVLLQRRVVGFPVQSS